MNKGRLQSFQDKLDNFKQICRENGLKLTPQRFEIYREMVLATDHPSADAIHHRVLERIPMVSVDTVYRTMATFEQLGLIARVHAFDDHARFDADLSDHHHFVCTRCQSVMDFEWPDFDRADLPENASGLGKVEGRQLVLRGVCRQCLNGACGGLS